MEAFLISTGIVALAEMGDKTQLLSLVLAARFRRPWPIVWGILVATLANHALAGALGTWVTTVLGPDVLRWVLGLSFLAMAAWMLIPDKLDADDADNQAPRFGVFGTTLLAFFLAEMGDKTQIATVMLAALTLSACEACQQALPDVAVLPPVVAQSAAVPPGGCGALS